MPGFPAKKGHARPAARRWLLLAWLLWLGSPGMAAAAQILLTGAQDNPSMQAFRDALAEVRPQDQVIFQPFDRLPAPGALPDNLRLILLDAPSLDWRLRDAQGPPTLVLRVSRLQAHQALGESRPPRLSLLWSDPPAIRQLGLLRLLMPQARRVGVLYGPQSEFLLSELRLAASQTGLEIVAQAWDAGVDNRPFIDLLKNSDVLLGIDDPDIYNAKTAKSLLLSSYSRQRALLGPSAAFVKAGSLASTYSDQTDWLAELDQLLNQPPQSWPRTLSPSQFKVISNRQVARALGIDMLDDSDYAKKLAQGATP